MTDTSACPNASYSVLSIVCGVIPSRAAVGRSYVSSACSPSFCWSVFTSWNPGALRNWLSS